MGKNFKRVRIDYDQNWTAPAGVNQIRVITKQRRSSVIGAEGSSTFIRDKNSFLYAVGDGTSGNLGDNTIVDKSIFVAVTGSVGYKGLAASGRIGITLNGDIYSWGYNGNGQIGNNTTTNYSSPVPITAPFRKFKKASRLGDTSGALATNGDVYCWGLGTSGAIGNGSTLDRSTPTLVSGGLKFIDVSMGYNYGLAITTSGDAYAWGAGTSGRLGDGTVISKSTPVAVSGGLKFKKVCAGGNTAYGITTDGDLYAWGEGTQGQIGNGAAANKSTPTLVSGGYKWKTISAGSFHAAGITTTGALYCWGDNGNGQLGDNTTVDKSTPTSITGGGTWFDVACGYFHNIALNTAGAIRTWGYNSNGQLGDNTTTSRSTPTLTAEPNPLYFPLVQEEAIIEDTMLSVTPGTTYAIAFTYQTVSFGSIAYLGAQPDALEIEYFA